MTSYGDPPVADPPDSPAQPDQPDQPDSRDPLGPAVLFCPGDRPERFAKAAERADTVILDLEDAVVPDAKAAARDTVAAALPGLGPLVIVRVNAVDTPWFADDVAMLRRVGHRRMMLPKVGSAADVELVRDLWVFAICETAAGVLHAEEIAAHPACAAIMWGGEDLVADLGGRRSRDAAGRYYPVVEHARSRVLLAAVAGGAVAVDSLHLDIGDLEGLARECAEAVDVGFAAKICIHPSQVPVIRAAFTPAPEQVEWARAVLEAARTEHGAFRYDGRMVDEPLLRQARAVLARVD